MMRARHNLVWMDGSGQDYAVKTARPLRPGTPDKMAEDLIRSGIPAIVRRQENPRDTILEVGFSSWEYTDGTRLRVSAEIPVSSVVKVVSPLHVATLYDYHTHPHNRILKKLFTLAEKHLIEIGIYGSTALQIVTGLPYSRPGSDIDLYLRKSPKSNLRDFYEAMQNIAKCNGISLDAELDIGNSYAIKLAEYFSGQKTVLAKGYNGVELLLISQLNQSEEFHI